MPFVDGPGVLPADEPPPNGEPVLTVAGLKLNPPKPPLLLPPKALDDPKAEVAAGAAADEELAPPKLKPEVAGAVVVGVDAGLPKEKPTLEVKPFGEPPELPNPKDGAAFGEVAGAALPNVNGFEGVVLLEADEFAAAGAPKEKPVNGFGGAAAAGLGASSGFLLSAGSVSTCLKGDGCLALLLAPGKNGAALPDRLFEAACLLFDDGSGDSLLSFCADAEDAAGGKANIDFSSDGSAFEALKVKPPPAELEEALAVFDGSGLRVFPAKLKDAGAEGGAGPFGVSAAGGGVLLGSSAFFSIAGAGDAAGVPKEKPEKGLGAVVTAAESFASGVVGVDVTADAPNEKPAKGFGAAAAGAGAGAGDDGAGGLGVGAAEDDDEGGAKLNIGFAF